MILFAKISAFTRWNPTTSIVWSSISAERFSRRQKERCDVSPPRCWENFERGTLTTADAHTNIISIGVARVSIPYFSFTRATAGWVVHPVCRSPSSKRSASSLWFQSFSSTRWWKRTGSYSRCTRKPPKIGTRFVCRSNVQGNQKSSPLFLPGLGGGG